MGNKPNLLWPNGLQNKFAIRMKDTWRLKVEQVDTYAKVNKINMYIIRFNKLNDPNWSLIDTAPFQ